MTSFVVMLEDMLMNSGRDDWEIMYDPEVCGYFLKIDDDVIFMTKVCERKDKNNE